jgi:hypothetical protein
LSFELHKISDDDPDFIATLVLTHMDDDGVEEFTVRVVTANARMEDGIRAIRTRGWATADAVLAVPAETVEQLSDSGRMEEFLGYMRTVSIAMIEEGYLDEE